MTMFDPTIACCECGIVFGVPQHWLSSRKEDRRSFWCPNGHPQSFRESVADKLQRELDRAKQNEAYLNDRIKSAREDADHERRRRIALAGQVTKAKNRAAAGVCPCCNRTFKQLAAHMKDKHPKFTAEPLDDAKVVPIRSAS